MARHYFLFNDLLVATKPIATKGWGKMFSSKKKGQAKSKGGQAPTAQTLSERTGAQPCADGDEGIGAVDDGGGSYTYKRMVALSKCELRYIDERTAEKRWGHHNVFQLITADQNILTFESSSPEDRDAWLLALDEGSCYSWYSLLLCIQSPHSIQCAAISTDLEIYRHRMGQVLGLGTFAGQSESVEWEKRLSETAKELGAADMFGTLYQHTSTDEWKSLWFILKNAILYVFKRKPEPHEKYVHGGDRPLVFRAYDAST